jgi:hypothetical protein
VLSGFPASLVVLALIAVSAFGWGRPIARWGLAGERAGPALTVALGLSVWVLLGGFLNAFHLAYRPALWAVLGAGMLLSAAVAVTAFRAIPRPLSPVPVWRGLRSAVVRGHWVAESLAPGVLIVGLLLFTSATLLPTAAFNFHDDFHTYFPRVFRMLQTGTVAGDPFELLGIDSLGSQSFLQALLLLFWPASFLNGMDAVFCFSLAAALVWELMRHTGARTWMVPAGVVALILVNPQLVNISAVYMGAAAILALVLAIQKASAAGALAGAQGSLRRWVPAGLLLAMLVSSKLTFAPFAAFFGVFWFALTFRAGAGRRRMVAGIAPSLLGMVFLLPWVSLVASNYWAALRLTIHKGGGAHPSYLMLAGRPEWIASTRALFWGGTPLDYLLITALVLITAMVGLRAVARGARRELDGPVLAPLVACGLATAGMYALNWVVFTPEHAVRYSCGVLLAGVPVGAAILGRVLEPGARVSETAPGDRWRPGRSAVAALVLTTFLGWRFGALLVERAQRAHGLRTTLSYPLPERYEEYNQWALSPRTRDALRTLQGRMEAGETVLAVTSISFWLDFGRNRIDSASTPSKLSHPWLNFPLGADADTMRAYLRGMGIRYVFWQPHGYGMKPEGKMREKFPSSPLKFELVTRYLSFMDSLRALEHGGYAVGVTDEFVLIDLDRPRSH